MFFWMRYQVTTRVFGNEDDCWVCEGPLYSLDELNFEGTKKVEWNPAYKQAVSFFDNSTVSKFTISSIDNEINDSFS